MSRHPGRRAGRARALQGPGHGRVQRDGQDEQDEQGGPAAPQHEVAPDVADQPSVGCLGGEFRRGRLGWGRDPIGHPSLPPADSPPRAAVREPLGLAQLLSQGVDVGVEGLLGHGHGERPA